LSAAGAPGFESDDDSDRRDDAAEISNVDSSEMKETTRPARIAGTERDPYAAT
jgi:hypothetical protein